MFQLPSQDENITPEKRVNRDKCNFATKQRMFGGFAIDEILRYRWTQFAHFMPPWFWPKSKYRGYIQCRLLHIFLYRNSTGVTKNWLLNNLSHIVALGGFKCNNKSLALWRHIPQHEKRGMDLICKSLFCFTCAKIPHMKVVPSWYLRKEVNREVRSFDFELSV